MATTIYIQRRIESEFAKKCFWTKLANGKPFNERIRE